mmetsp:Transcript_43603/g.113577  ORF Transcript_43603/g.113577 Transcript_43603/m.113577 type:complete len:667 (-) Transcript_43603:133-2133(-)|eukprot:CAMPEP_0113899072 /NCGR_PEP_ID=MMETSP0780_2-20120614/19783_1 /TAXON_ID=652834 /ORGANISM="Palpitomonas bilix" /LENGTH=666 /DNA_ID=CAMNT_0000891109 /DNA_START=283 /DNA_END=2283 /DNA_ORIENTATION=+ /assembly_acc=CAM_ASM_000599
MSAPPFPVEGDAMESLPCPFVVLEREGEKIIGSISGIRFDLNEPSAEYEGDIFVTNIRMVLASRKRVAKVGPASQAAGVSWQQTVGGLGVGALSSISDLLVKPISGAFHLGLRGFMGGIESSMAGFVNSVKYSTGGRSAQGDPRAYSKAPAQYVRNEGEVVVALPFPFKSELLTTVAGLANTYVSLPLRGVMDVIIDKKGSGGEGEGQAFRIEMRDFRAANITVYGNSACEGAFDEMQRAVSSTKQSERIVSALKEYVFDTSWKTRQECVASLALQQNQVKFFDMKAEFRRMGVPSANWVPSTLNDNFQLCSSYPSLLYIPSDCPPEVVRGASEFHSSNRLPVLTWANRQGAAMCRCSQPLVGVRSVRSSHDEEYVGYLAGAADLSQITAEEGGKKIMVVDARPYSSTVANRTRNGGFLDPSHYPVDLQFMSIENIHVMQKAWQKLRSICCLDRDGEDFWAGLSKSGWLSHLSAILEASMTISAYLQQDRRVLVHCSDGWDRTSQLCAVAQLLSDPYFRTMRGFCILCEKEFVAFGHRFRERYFFGGEGEGPKMSPVFLQFLDAVRQVIIQCPDQFEFNSSFLLAIADGVYCGVFKSFFYNSEKERVESGECETSLCLWTTLLSEVDAKGYKNMGFHSDRCEEFLRVRTEDRHMQLWREYFLRFDV